MNSFVHYPEQLAFTRDRNVVRNLSKFGNCQQLYSDDIFFSLIFFFVSVVFSRGKMYQNIFIANLSRISSHFRNSGRGVIDSGAIAGTDDKKVGRSKFYRHYSIRFLCFSSFGTILRRERVRPSYHEKSFWIDGFYGGLRDGRLRRCNAENTKTFPSVYRRLNADPTDVPVAYSCGATRGGPPPPEMKSTIIKNCYF